MTMPTHDHDIARRLRASRRTLRRWLVSVAAVRIGAAAMGVLLVLGGLDYALRLPAWIRWLHLIVGLAALAWALRARVRPALGFRPTLADTALYIEQKRSDLQGRVASALELQRLASTQQGVSGELARLAAQRADAPAEPLLTGMIARSRLFRATATLLCAIIVLVALSAWKPATVATAAVRTLAPWSQAMWPKRTEVRDVTQVALHPRGETLPLRAALMRSNRTPGETDVGVRVRVLRDGKPVRTDRLLATWQARQIAGGDELFEAIADTDGDALEYRFETLDDATNWTRVELVERPEILQASAMITRPAYVSASLPDGEPDTIDVELGNGTDERSAAPPTLLGSEVELSLTLNKPMRASGASPEWLESTFGPDAEGLRVEPDMDGTGWEVRFTLEGTRVLRIALADERGIESADSAIFRFTAQQDQAPAVVVVDPAFDDTALPQAVVALSATAADDVALASLWVSAQRFEPEGEAPSGRGGAMEAAGEETVLERASVSAGDVRAEVRHDVALHKLGARPGDEIRLWATGVDIYAFETGLREPTRSAARRVFIVSEQEFVEDIRTALSGVRREAIRLFDAQQDVIQRSQRDELSGEELRREQDPLTNDIARQRERIDALRERIATNRLDDERLDALTRDADRAAATAEASSQAASQAAEGGNPEEAAQFQERTLDDLGELIALLDSGEDAWTARRNLERLLREQQENLEATRELGRETAGLSVDALDEEQRAELEKIADMQAELAERSRSAQQALRETEEALQESDPATAAALEQAAQSMERGDVTRRMEDAAQQAQANQTSRAAASQEEAIDRLQEALEELDNAERARDEQLRRLAQSLVDTIKGLIATQQEEIARLERGARELDRTMIALHTRTIAAAQTALAERELRPAARPLEDAAQAQLDAIGALRQAPIDIEAASTGEQESLARLEDALAEAERLQQELEQDAADRAREELKQAYESALAQQTELRDRAQDATGDGELDRRARAALRRLSAEQKDLSGTVSDLYAETQELADAVVFRFAHKRLDGAMERATEGLRTPDAEEALHAQARAIVLLRGMIEALEEEQQDEETFDESGGGGGGSGGQQGGEPEMIPGGAQLKLLRSIQSDLLDRTRAVDDGRRPESDLGSLGAEQRELSEIGQALIDELMNQQNAPVQLEKPEQAPEGDES